MSREWDYDYLRVEDIARSLLGRGQSVYRQALGKRLVCVAAALREIQKHDSGDSEGKDEVDLICLALGPGASVAVLDEAIADAERTRGVLDAAIAEARKATTHEETKP